MPSSGSGWQVSRERRSTRAGGSMSGREMDCIAPATFTHTPIGCYPHLAAGMLSRQVHGSREAGALPLAAEIAHLEQEMAKKQSNIGVGVIDNEDGSSADHPV